MSVENVIILRAASNHTDAPSTTWLRISLNLSIFYGVANKQSAPLSTKCCFSNTFPVTPAIRALYAASGPFIRNIFLCCSSKPSNSNTESQRQCHSRNAIVAFFDGKHDIPLGEFLRQPMHSPLHNLTIQAAIVHQRPLGPRSIEIKNKSFFHFLQITFFEISSLITNG